MERKLEIRPISLETFRFEFMPTLDELSSPKDDESLVD